MNSQVHFDFFLYLDGYPGDWKGTLFPGEMFISPHDTGTGSVVVGWGVVVNVVVVVGLGVVLVDVLDVVVDLGVILLVVVTSAVVVGFGDVDVVDVVEVVVVVGTTQMAVQLKPWSVLEFLFATNSNIMELSVVDRSGPVVPEKSKGLMEHINKDKIILWFIHPHLKKTVIVLMLTKHLIYKIE